MCSSPWLGPGLLTIVKKGVGKGKGSIGKSAEPRKLGPRQQAQQLKKQRFNKVLSDLAAKKTFFMSFLRHPCLMSADGIRKLLLDLTDVMRTSDYKKMLLVSAKKTEKVALLKAAIFTFNGGRHGREKRRVLNHTNVFCKPTKNLNRDS